MTLIQTILAVLFLIALSALFFSLLIGASVICLFLVKVPFVPTPKKYVKAIIDQLALRPGQIFYDLGCGDGRFLVEAAKRGAKAAGFELGPWPYFRAKVRLGLNQSRGRIYFKNFYHQNLSEADAVFCFLLDKVMPKVEAKLRQELKPGAKFASYGFPLPNRPADKIVYLNPATKKSSKLYLYIVNH